jgi:hypothetical protein
MKNNPILAIFLFILIGSCDSSKEQSSDALEQDKAILVSAAGFNATNPFLTKNHVGHPALCWTEELHEGEGFVVKYAVFDPEEAAFGDIITVAPSKGTSAHPENMNKLAFKSDGTTVAVYSRKQPTEENRFAGSLLYTQSFDGGKSWTEEAYLHSDTSRNVGRGYFDLATLADGEVGAVWLDGRHGKASKGSALFFAKTLGRQGFGEDKDIGESTCECCRTDLYIDGNNRLNIVYRDILNDSIRDIVHQYSADNGDSFSAPRRISHDNWIINGCPHTGPSLASTSSGLHAVWFTAGGAPGVYLTSTTDHGKTFSLRNKISDKARHPQMTALPDDRLVLVWDEMQDKSPEPVHAGMHQGGGHGAPVGGSKIVLQIRKGTTVLKTRTLSSLDADASYPVLAHAQGKCLVAWSQQTGWKSAIYYRWVDLAGEM